MVLMPLNSLDVPLTMDPNWNFNSSIYIYMIIYVNIYAALVVLDEDRYLFLVDSAKVYFNGLSVAGPGVVWKLSR